MSKVSIIIPTTGRDFFKYAYLSAINQTFKDIEIVICNYGNSDFPEKIIEKYPDKRVKYYKLPDPGRLEGYRKGIKFSNGEYIKLLLDDDMLENNSIEMMTEVLDNYKDVVLVSSNRYIINYKNEIIGEFNASSKNNKNYIINGIEAGDVMLEKIVNYIGEPSTVLFRRKDLNVPFGQFIGVDALCNDDVASWLTLLLKGKFFYFTNSLAYFRKHKKQVQKKTEFLAKGIIDWIIHIQKGKEVGFLKDDKRYFNALAKIVLSEVTQKALETSTIQDKILLSELLKDTIEIIKPKLK